MDNKRRLDWYVGLVEDWTDFKHHGNVYPGWKKFSDFSNYFGVVKSEDGTPIGCEHGGSMVLCHGCAASLLASKTVVLTLRKAGVQDETIVEALGMK